VGEGVSTSWESGELRVVCDNCGDEINDGETFEAFDESSERRLAEPLLEVPVTRTPGRDPRRS